MTLTAEPSALRTDPRTPYAHPSIARARPLAGALAPRPHWSRTDLARLTRLLVTRAAGELHRAARFDPAARWYLRLARTEQVEVWLLTWTPGQHTLPHDHGGASGAYTVLDGRLTETWRDGPARSLRADRGAGRGAAFSADRVHVVSNDGPLNAISVHAYSPPLLPLGVGMSLQEPPG